MAVSTYAELKASIANWLNRTDLTTEIIDFIRLAEARLNTDLLTSDREQESSASSSAARVTLPADCYGIRSVFIDADPRTILEPLAIGELRQTYTAAATGLPQHYAVVGGDTLVFGPAPDATYTYVLVYWADIPALSDSNTTNWLLTAYPDLYLSCALVEALLLLKDEKRAEIWDGRAARQIEAIKRAGRRKAQGGAPRRLRAPQVV